MNVSNLLKPTIQKRIFSGYALVIIIVLVMLFVSYNQLNTVQRESDEFLPNSALLAQLQDFALSLSSFEAAVDQYFVIGGAQQRDNVFLELDAMRETVAAIEDQATGELREWANENDALPLLNNLTATIDRMENDIEVLTGQQTVALTPRDINQRTAALYADADVAGEIHQTLTDTVLAHFEDTVDEQNEVVNNLVTQFILVGVIVVVVSVAASLFISRFLATPLAAMARTATQIASGNFEERVTVVSRDETGLLADAFNAMTEQLEGFIGTLEQRVMERTRDLAVVADVAARASTLLNVPELLDVVTNLTKDNLGLYHAHIYLVNATEGNLVLAAGAGDVGRALVSQGHRIPLQAQQSLVAQAARDRTAVSVHDVRERPNFLANPLLPNTRSELAVALVARDTLLGVLDVQDDEVGRFDEQTQSVMETLARQIAAALSNAQLFSEVEEASRHEQTLRTITEQIQTAVDLDDLLQTAARELGKALRVPRTTIQLGLESAAPAPTAVTPPVDDLEAAPG